MIRARFDRRGVTLSGHAGYAPRGQDIVCAAVSSLFYVQARLWEQRGVLQEVRAEEGFARLTAREGSGAQPEVLALGLQWLSAAYPDCVQVEN